MAHSKKIPLAALLAGLALPLAAQEPWDAHFKLTAGHMGGAEENRVGQDKVYGLALGGAYPLTLRGYGVVEGGYKVLPTASVGLGDGLVEDDTSDAYYACAMYRHEIWRNGVYVQGGVRAYSAKTARDVVRPRAGGKSDHLARLRGPRETRAGWCAGVGFRLTDLWSVELGASNATFGNLDGAYFGGTMVEVALCIHR
jgi:hypothetical protein